MGSIYSADHGVLRPHLITISLYHTLKIATLSVTTISLTRFVKNLVYLCNCLDRQHRVVSYLLTRCLCSSNQNRTFSRILFGCSMGEVRCPSDYARAPSLARLTVCKYIERLKYCMPYYCYVGNNTSNNILADLYLYQMCMAVDPIPYPSRQRVLRNSYYWNHLLPIKTAVESVLSSDIPLP
jgi:hypothetical protein